MSMCLRREEAFLASSRRGMRRKGVHELRLHGYYWTTILFPHSLGATMEHYEYPQRNNKLGIEVGYENSKLKSSVCNHKPPAKLPKLKRVQCHLQCDTLRTTILQCNIGSSVTME
eukprot:5923416-Amphidinium_carterae.1